MFVGYSGLKMAAAAAFMGGTLLLGTGGALAQNLCPGVSATQCTDFCGAAGVASCTKTGSVPDCVCNETTKDVNGNAFGTATEDTAEGKGNIGNKTETDCDGNQGQCKQ
ncbi:hypothetical protein GCM10010869_75450 [Mesorhizobium tianshanense]|uniref:Uncharacterized protein n=1 Tax=Mesorhizobium tianshanense TaxID=39844 RepID=A0A562MEY1_9HYPH|nr:hypothetical protein [Mesorhizobium tianshanense]TWI18460.1 hypothetical protein IQ26_07324 [Mesorhizobium tianshanense]GLS41948.1 hypothetical protein GCM10010869_75450 [Mesorhizobium tianshanense]